MMMDEIIISRDDWSLHRKGYDDQKRHLDKIKEVMKKHLPDLISDESIILTNGKKNVKIPVHSLDEHHFRYNYNKQKLVGQGEGESQIGDLIGRDKNKSNGDSHAGDLPGADYYEVEVSFEQIEEALFAELELPRLINKDLQDMIVKDSRFNDVRKKGLQGNIDKKRTILANMKRNALKGKAEIANISPDDLRFKTWNEVLIPHTKAVVLAMMDTSGSMGYFEKYVARTFFFWLVRFLRLKYEDVEILFIAHHTEAKVVNEEEFFTKGESGGTICSSAYLKALELIKENYSPLKYNIYAFHFSDGDNLTTDKEKSIKAVNDLLQYVNLFGYGEINQYFRHSTLIEQFKEINKPNFLTYVIRDKKEIYLALRHFFANPLLKEN